MSSEDESKSRPLFDLLRVYAKDSSLETPHSPIVFQSQWKPELQVKFNTKTTKIDDDQFEVTLRITVNCSNEGKTAFICEVTQAGVFLLRNSTSEAGEFLLGGTAPNILFTYAREFISSLVSRATFPQLNLAPINFEALFRARNTQQKKESIQVINNLLNSNADATKHSSRKQLSSNNSISALGGLNTSNNNNNNNHWSWQHSQHDSWDDATESLQQDSWGANEDDEDADDAYQTLLDCVSDWDEHENQSLKHKWFVPYYPYHKYKDSATADMWDDWKFIWNFKDGEPTQEHEDALKRAIKLTESALRRTFRNNVDKLTLVCVPASSADKNNQRFKTFARTVCQDLGMNNGFGHIKITADATPKHKGGTGKPTKWYDSSFFRGKYVIIFDDVSTTGKSLVKEKAKLESLGAKVIGAITLAQTQS